MLKMNRKMLIAIIALAMFAALIAAANAQITATITVKDASNNIISGGTVHLGTVAYVSGNYLDLHGSSPASGQIDVYFNDGSGLVYKATIWSGNLNDGQTATAPPYAMNELGTYEFRFTCQAGTAETLAILRCDERVQARTTIQLTVPEPGTLAGLAMALSAFGFLAVRKARAKITH
jgi:hypothetical protein